MAHYKTIRGNKFRSLNVLDKMKGTRKMKSESSGEILCVSRQTEKRCELLELLICISKCWKNIGKFART